jgi:dihydroorotate dehydrogenase
MYTLLRDILFHFPPEEVHHFSMQTLQTACKSAILKDLITRQFSFHHPSLGKKCFGLHFHNPVGLAAGFDKNAQYLRELEVLGFGFVEIGTVTPRAQPGNEQPRVFRLPKDKALINRMGFNNEGVTLIAQRLRARLMTQEGKESNMLIGGNIGKNKVTPNEDAWKDYESCFRELFDCVDYFVVNVSSPNTPGLRELQEKESLRKILSQLQSINYGQFTPKPLLLKIAPDLTVGQLDDIIDLALEIKLDGLVATNTTIQREPLVTRPDIVEQIGAGGLSGKPVAARSTEILKYMASQTQSALSIIASGGIFTGEDAREKLNAGAALVQVWTGFIYEGPMIVKNICKKLVS